MTDRFRRRIVVIQVLVLSLFGTLFGRLWHLQVVTGDQYQRQAVENYVREVAVPPARGLILDAMGRPLVSNRTSIVVTVDRGLLSKLPDDKGRRVLHRVARVLDQRYRDVWDATRLCGEEGAKPPPVCWNGSPYEPIPVAEDVGRPVALAIMEQPEDFPGVTAESRAVRTYPRPFDVNAAHVLGYLSPVTERELETTTDATLQRNSVVGRAGLEREYDEYLRGTPGVRAVAVDSLGRVTGIEGRTAPRVGANLVTSIDARVQAVVERQLHQTVRTARQTFDEVTGRKYEADEAAAVVLDATNGRVVAMAGYPTYNPEVWVGGISQRAYDRLTNENGTLPLLPRPIQAQLAPGSTFKPITTAAALTSGYTTSSRLDCSSSFTVGDRVFQNYESAAYGYIDFATALRISCDTFFYRIAYDKWLDAGGDSGDVDVKDPIVAMAKDFGLGRETGIDLPDEEEGRIASRQWKLAWWKDQKDYYCEVAEEPGSDYLHIFAREFCVDGWRYRAGDAVNFAIGQGDTTLTPLQLAVAYAAISNGGTLWEPRVAKAVVAPDGDVVHRIKPERAGRLPVPDHLLDYIDRALRGTPISGTAAWRFADVGFPLDQVHLRAKTGTAEVYGKQTTSWLATYDERYVVVMMVAQGGTGSGTSGPGVRRIWEALYGIRGGQVHRAEAAQPGARPPRALPRIKPDGRILPPPGVRELAAAKPDRTEAGRGT